MPRFPIIGALFVSLALIVGALWSRFDDKKGVVALIALNEKGETVTVGEMSVDEYLGFDPIVDTQTGENLDETELLSRQLLSEYLFLSSQNESTPENLKALGGKLADTLLSEDYVPLAKLEQLKITADTNENFLSYNQKLLQLRTKYSVQVDSDKDIGSVFDDKLKNAMSELASLYGAAAQELLGFSVPSSLAQNHIELVNIYLSTSGASLAVSQIEKNPAKALAALKTLSENSEEEEARISTVRVILMSRGLLLPANL